MPSNYVLLERIELNASASSVVFNNIPQSGYTDLKLELSVRQTNASAFSTMQLQINGSTANFTNRILEADTAGSPGSSTSPARYVGYLNASTSTANTFASASIYFPNYLASTNKSYSIDYTSEANATSSWLGFVAGLWSSTTAISSISLVPSTGSIAANSTFSLYGLAAVGTTPVIAPKATGGNLIENDGTYWIHTFYSTGTFTPLQGLSCDYLVVAGGGGGGFDTGGGGGAGGLRSTVTATGGGGSLESALSVSNQAYTVTIGAGGAGSTSGSAKGTNGTNSVFGSITSTGGGGGGSDSTGSGADGGSGGGKVNANRTGSGGLGTANQGYNGGTSTFLNGGGSGGGGAGAAGTGSTSTTGGVGGNGIATTISGTSTFYAGGGGGGGGSTTNPSGGTGGGGAGGSNSAPGTGSTNTGGGGGGGRGSTTLTGAAGGSGIVIIRYPIA